MKRKVNIISNVLTFVFTLALVFGVVYIAGQRWSNTWLAILFFVIGAIICGFLCTLMHELGHLIFGKANGFALISFTVWFFKFTKIKNKTEFSFSMIKDSAGATEMVPKHNQNLKKRLYNMTFGGPFFTAIAMFLGIIPLVIPQVNFYVFCIFSMFLPIGAYCFFGNVLPVGQNGNKNDGALLYSLKKFDDDARVIINLISIHGELYNGKSPCEIDKSLYFDLPQLPEDNVNFINLLNARYNFYLDGFEKENALKVSERLRGLYDYMPKDMATVIKVDELYNVCALKKDEERADELMYELEKYLNANNNATNLRVKIAYIYFIRGEIDGLEQFFNKAKKEAKKSKLKGLAVYEGKLIEDLFRTVNADI